MARAVCPGSFDPVTLGHVDVLRRASALFDSVVVGVGSNPGKNPYFAPSERVEMLTEVCADLPGVEIALFDGLLVNFCRSRGANVIVKGLRAGGDFDYELQMAQMNASLTGIDTVFLPTAAQWSYVSSSLVREIARLGGDVGQFLPEPAARRVAERTGRTLRST